MNVCFIQIAENQWIETSNIMWIETIPGGGYHLVLVGYNELIVSGEYAINVERLLRANHFGQLVLQERTGSDSGGTGCANGPEVSSFLGVDK